jgi:hypothetical protein
MGHAFRVSDASQLPEHLRRQIEAQTTAARCLARGAPRLSAAPPATPEPVTKPKRRTGDPEHQEQVVFINRLKALAVNKPTYAMAVKRTHAIPNGGRRSKREAGRLKAEGVVAGVADIFVAYPVPGFHGLYIEMKSLTGKPSREQQDWIRDSLALGYQAAVCRGADEAMKVWLEYVDG